MSFSQVGGHPNSIQLTEDGSLLIKPALPLEHEFYTLMAQARAMDSMGLAGGEGDGVGNERALNERTLHGLKNLKRLSRFVPEFYGTLREESIDVETLNADSKDIGDGGIGAMMFKDTSNAMVDAVALNKSSRQHLVLSNLLHSFTKPNVLDLKLGTVLYDELDLECSEAKKARMIKTARETTSGVCGIRITGFQVHPQPSASPVNTGTNAVSKQLTPIITTKLYGKSLKKEQLPEGMRRVFPVLGEPVPIAIPETTSAAGSASSSGSSTPFEAYTSSTASSNVPYSDSTFKQPRTNLGLPPDLLLPILRSIHTSLTHLHSIMQGVELRMVGGSLLVVWEGDEQRAREGVEWMKEREIKITERIRQEADVEGNEDDDSEYLDSDDDDEGGTSSDEDNENVSAHEPSPDSASALTDETNIASRSTSRPSSKSHRRKPSAPYALSLIDFAHTRFVPGQGPDVGVLLGLDTFAKLIEGRILEVEDIEVGRQGSK
ncbi:hypothetical protein HHX47_DHR5000035 [Lentinula edodes]|nr:hypothetical protein HHX47_DHR5000035 [Lentinula edodes]